MSFLSTTDSRPTTNMVDIMREMAFREIGRITGEIDPSIDSPEKLAREDELEMVKIQILNIINNAAYSWKLSQDARIELANAFANLMPMVWEPNEDGGTNSTYNGPYTGI